MKVRASFVSNSSSSSYIIAVDKNRSKKICPHCYRSSIDIVEYIQNSCCQDNEVEHSSGESFIAELKEDIQCEKKDIETLLMNRRLDFKDAYGCTDRQRIDWANERIQENKKLIKRIEQYLAIDYDIKVISISYHDSIANQIFREIVANEEIIVLKSEEN